MACQFEAKHILPYCKLLKLPHVKRHKNNDELSVWLEKKRIEKYKGMKQMYCEL